MWSLDGVTNSHCDISVYLHQLEVIGKGAGTRLAVRLAHQVHHLLLVHHASAGQDVKKIIRPEFSHAIGARHVRGSCEWVSHLFFIEGE
jgi:hypothetical protein